MSTLLPQAAAGAACGNGGRCTRTPLRPLLQHQHRMLLLTALALTMRQVGARKTCVHLLRAAGTAPGGGARHRGQRCSALLTSSARDPRQNRQEKPINPAAFCRELQEQRREADPDTAAAIDAVLDQLDACASAERDYTITLGASAQLKF